MMVLALSGVVRGQNPIEDKPEPLDSTATLTPQEREHHQALLLYAQGLVLEHNNQLLEAVRTLEKALELDPRSVALYRALIPLYLTLERHEEALEACRKSLELDSKDYEIWYLYACQLRDRGQPREARDALVRAAACPELKKRQDLFVQVHNDLGMLYEEAQDPVRAEAAYRRVVRALNKVLENQTDSEGAPEAAAGRLNDLQTQVIETYERIVRVCLQGQLYDRAIAAFREAEQKNLTRGGRLNYPMARVYLGKGEPAKALHYLEEYLKTQPAGAEAYEFQITLLQKLGRDQDILPSLQRYAERDAHNVSLQLLLAQHYAQAGQDQKAAGLYHQLADEAPTPEVYRGWFSLYRGARMGEALRIFDQAVADAAGKNNGPGDPAAAAKARAMLVVFRDDQDVAKDLVQAGVKAPQDLQMETVRFLAALAARAHQLEGAEQLYRRCLEGHLSPETKTDVYLGLIQVLWEEHKRAEVAAVCRQGLKEFPGESTMLFHRNLALALALLGKSDEALAEADEAVNRSEGPLRVRMRMLRVEVLRSTNRFQEAAAECLALLQGGGLRNLGDSPLPADIRDIRYLLSNVYSSSHELDKAEEQLRLILKDDPNDVSANNDLGYLLADEGKDLEEAELLIRKAMEVDREQRKAKAKEDPTADQDHAAYIDSLGWVLFRRGHLEEAREQLERAVSLPEGADDPVVWDHLGDVYWTLHDTARARAAWEKAVQFFEAETRRKPDRQYQEIKHKLQQNRGG
ncbi:MAG: tetratricopeptide repeat protein [Planctomycetes bacterium]|nr:tetratricopeptide repeat protein [Planctomycetota bacterium]